MGDKIVTVTDNERVVWSGKFSAFFTSNSAALDTGKWRILLDDGAVLANGLLVTLAA